MPILTLKYLASFDKNRSGFATPSFLSTSAFCQAQHQLCAQSLVKFVHFSGSRMLKFYIMCLSYFKLNQKRILPISKYFASFLWSKKAFQLDCLAGASCVERLTKFLIAKFFSSSVQQRFWGGFVSLFGFCGL